MSFKVVAHMGKFHRGDVGKIERHNQREGEVKNELIDPERSHLNYDLANPNKISYLEKIEQIIAQGRKGKPRKIQSNAVLLSSWIISATPDFFKESSTAQQQAYFKDALKFFEARYGSSNIVAAQVHLDETTPHMHLSLVPLKSSVKKYKDGRQEEIVKLCSKELFDRKELTWVQDNFHLQVAGKYGIGRGEKDSKRPHLSEQEYKRMKQEEAFAIEKKQRELEETKAYLKKLREENAALEKMLGEAKKRTGELSRTIDDLLKKDAMRDVLEAHDIDDFDDDVEEAAASPASRSKERPAPIRPKEVASTSDPSEAAKKDAEVQLKKRGIMSTKVYDSRYAREGTLYKGSIVAETSYALIQWTHSDAMTIHWKKDIAPVTLKKIEALLRSGKEVPAKIVTADISGGGKFKVTIGLEQNIQEQRQQRSRTDMSR